jgi:N6-L-threonylcarbamoyladenine synthase
MLALAIDTSTKAGTAALYHSEQGLVAEINLNVNLNHSDTVMSAIDTLFELSGKSIKDVEKIAVSTGPGSFTGIRVGVGTAKGLAYSLKVPIVGVNELDLIANLSPQTTMKIISLIDARKERVYYAEYAYGDHGVVERKSDYRDGELRSILEGYRGEEILVLGDGSVHYRELIKEVMGNKAFFASRSLSLPRASVMAEISLYMPEDNIFHLEPFYLSKTQAERNKGKK